ncbi:MAG: NUDIX domain-containing protein [Syntrophaceae bacterium]|nr:NUDIX domain-containing protein [Syntrophaceae bacterium]
MKYPVPIVRLIIPDDRGRVLILKRKNTEYGSGQWCLPGGKIDYGQPVEQAIVEELFEETGLSAVTWKFLFYQDSLPPETGEMHCINLYFECSVSGTIVLNKESSDYDWVGQADLSTYDIVFNNDLALLTYWKNSIE